MDSMLQSDVVSGGTFQGDSSEFDVFDNHTMNGTFPPGAPKAGATIVSPVIMFLTGLIGNTLALVVLYKTKTEIRRTMFYTLVAGLAWTDITGQVLTSPVSILTYINGLKFPGGYQLCKFHGFIMGCFGLSTPCLVCAMAVERFLAIKCPYFYSKYCNRSAARVTILLLWGGVLLVCIFPLMGFGEYSLQYPGTWCFLNFHTEDPLLGAYGYLYACLNLGIILVMTGCNIFVGATLLRVRFVKKYSQAYHCDHCDMGSDQTFSSLKRRQQHAVQMQMIWLMCAITTVFAVCCAPLMVQIVKTLATGRADHVGDLLAVRLTSINQILDPWLYILVRRSFLRKVVRCCRKMLSLPATSDRLLDKPHKVPPKVLIFPPPDEVEGPNNDNPNSPGIRAVVENDIVGLYNACPHCKNERRRDMMLTLVYQSKERLPDVMCASDERRSDSSDLPDVTPERSVGRTTDGQESSTGSGCTSGYYDTELEPIYVDVFLLPRHKNRVRSSETPEPSKEDESDWQPQSLCSVDETSVFLGGGSTSGISSWNNPPSTETSQPPRSDNGSPRRPYRSLDVTFHTKESHKQSDGRRIKSYT